MSVEPASQATLETAATRLLGLTPPILQAPILQAPMGELDLPDLVAARSAMSAYTPLEIRHLIDNASGQRLGHDPCAIGIEVGVVVERLGPLGNDRIEITH